MLYNAFLLPITPIPLYFNKLLQSPALYKLTSFNSKAKLGITKLIIEISITAKISAPEYTNQILTSTDAEGNIVGLLKNKRYNSSDTLVDSDIHDACGFIPVKVNDVVRFKNMGFGSIADGSCYLRLYSSDKKTKRAETTPYALNHGGFPTETNTKILNIKYDNNNVIEFTVGSGCNYLRIAWRNVGQTEPAIITVNEEIV